LDLVTSAYHVNRELVSGPSWLGTERFNIVARVAAGATKEQLNLMLQNLLRQRFKLAVHTEKKEMSVYELVVAKDGPKFQESAAPPVPREIGTASSQAAPTEPPPIPSDKNGCADLPPGGITMMMTSDCAAVRVTRESMEWLVGLLSAQTGRIVTDGTGLKGKYDFIFSWRLEHDRVTAVPPRGEEGVPLASVPDLDKGPTLLVALRERLGLKLEPRKTMLDAVVVDRMEKKPTEN
jgi:uncharacterized protein (TIGR03435 family)